MRRQGLLSEEGVDLLRCSKALRQTFQVDAT
jgi:hypothetical protein